MSRIWTWIAVIVLVAVAAGVYLIQKTPSQADDEKVVRALVSDFGMTLQNVSLLAPEATVASSMDTQYGPYVAPALLAQWKNDPANAPGRRTSSPWPDRIDITSVTKESDTRYTVEGAIVEVSNEGGGIGESPTEAARRPVSMTVDNTDDGWRITALTLGAYPGDGAWQYSEPDAEGVQFMYPATLPTTYISAPAEGWPPQVSLTAGTYACADATSTPERQGETTERAIGDRTYCVTTVSEGAAGSTYTTYDYTTAQGERLARVTFTLRFPQCLNYDDPQKSACLAEQSSFDVDGLADRIASSIRRQ